MPFEDMKQVGKVALYLLCLFIALAIPWILIIRKYRNSFSSDDFYGFKKLAQYFTVGIITVLGVLFISPVVAHLFPGNDAQVFFYTLAVGTFVIVPVLVKLTNGVIRRNGDEQDL